MAKKKFNYKIFSSFLLFVTFLVMVVSGLILYIAPPGRVANWTYWNVWGFSKTEWTNFHLTFIVVFLVVGTLHLFYFNWKQFWAYVTTRGQGGLRFQKEMIAALVLSLVLLLGTWAKIPPMITVADLGEAISASWEDNRVKAPAAHAELMTLRQYAETIQEPVDNVLAVLRQKGFEPAGPDQVLKELAEKHKVAPSQIDALFKKGSQDASRATPSGGQGYGRMKFAEVAQSLGLTVDQAKRKLAAAGVTQVEDSQTLKEIGNANGLTPIQVLGILDPAKAQEH